MSRIRHVLVAGEAGFTGRAFVRTALRTHPDLRITVLESGDAATLRQLASEADATVSFAVSDLAQALLDAAVDYEHVRFVQVCSDGECAVDDLALANQQGSGLLTIVSGGCHAYGPYQTPAEIIPRFITNALLGLPLPVSGDGSARAAYVYVDDYAAAIDLLLHRGLPGVSYHVAGSEAVTALELADTVLRLCDRPAFLKHFVPTDTTFPCAQPWPSAALHQLGWQPRHDFGDAIRATVSWYREHESWWVPQRVGVA